VFCKHLSYQFFAPKAPALMGLDWPWTNGPADVRTNWTGWKSRQPRISTSMDGNLLALCRYPCHTAPTRVERISTRPTSMFWLCASLCISRICVNQSQWLASLQNMHTRICQRTRMNMYRQSNKTIKHPITTACKPSLPTHLFLSKYTRKALK
jgi:hypothetical protein